MADAAGETAALRRWKRNIPSHLMGLILLGAIVLAWNSPTSKGTAPAVKGAQVEMTEQRRSATTTCFRSTGGTCFVSGCAAERGNTTCQVSHGLGFLGWHSCECQEPAPCAHSDGKCYAFPEERWRASLRGEAEWLLGLSLAPMLRSGVTKGIAKVLALDHLTSVPQPPKKLDYISLRTWDQVREASDFEYKYQAYATSAIKGVVFHASQPTFFLYTYAAYSDSMGVWQWSFATIVVTMEVLYLCIIVFGINRNPRWLLYCPMSDEQDLLGDKSPGSLWYVAGPAVFILHQCDCQCSAVVVSVFNTFASLCGIVALCIGLSGIGVMFPSLAVAYVLCSLELFVFVLMILQS